MKTIRIQLKSNTRKGNSKPRAIVVVSSKYEMSPQHVDELSKALQTMKVTEHGILVIIVPTTNIAIKVYPIN